MAEQTFAETFAQPGTPIPELLADLPHRVVATRRTELDDAVAAITTPRVVIIGGPTDPDAYLAAVLSRLMIRERLDVDVAYLAPTSTPATTVYGLPTGDDAAHLARHGVASTLPLIRDDTATALVGIGRHCGVDALLTGESYVDNHRLFNGRAPGVVCSPTREEPGLRAHLTTKSLLTTLGLRKTQWHHGRAVQTGGIDVIVERDGIRATRGVRRSTFYRHHVDWKLVDHV